MKSHFPFGNFNNFKADKKIGLKRLNQIAKVAEMQLKLESLPSGQPTCPGLQESISMLLVLLCASYPLRMKGALDPGMPLRFWV